MYLFIRPLYKFRQSHDFDGVDIECKLGTVCQKFLLW